MKRDDFPLLNQVCEEFFQEDFRFIKNNILPLSELCKCLISLSKTIQYNFEEVLSRKSNSYKTEILPEESIKICSEFLEEKNPSLKKQFQTFLKNGVTNLVVVDEEDEISDMNRLYYGKQEILPDVNVGIYYNLTDAPYMIHEFFHGDNCTPIKHSWEWETHRILTETVSVYFEERMILYLKKLGYPEVELDRLTRLRYIDSMECSKGLINKLATLDCYQRIGKVSLEDYRIMKSLENPKRPLVFENEEDFIECCTKMESQLKNGYHIEYIPKYVAYTFGVSLAFLLLEQDKNNMDEKVSNLNDRIKNIYSYPNIFDNIELLESSLTQYFAEDVVKIVKGKMERIEPIYQDKKNK